MSDDAIYDEFATRVGAFAAQFSPALPTSYPGIGFDPPAGGTWLEVRWFPNETQNYGLADDAPALMQGFGQVSVCCTPGAGIVPSLAVVKQLIAYFPKGAEFDVVRVDRKPWASSVLEAANRIEIPVTIPWRGFDA